MYQCPRCIGVGELPHFKHVDNGICFQCDGTGKVPQKPQYIEVDESVTAIYRLRLMEGEQYYIATFYVWEDDGRKYANTGHYDIELIDPRELSDDDIGWCDQSYKSTTILSLDDAGGYHMPLECVRKQYKALINMGYQPVEFHPSLYYPEPF